MDRGVGGAGSRNTRDYMLMGRNRNVRKDFGVVPGGARWCGMRE